MRNYFLLFILFSSLSVQADEPRRFALVIGIDKYAGGWALDAAVADAKAVAERLKDLNFQVKMLLDQEATYANMRSALGNWPKKTQLDDQVLIYFAGHGLTEGLPNQRKEGYILPVDVNLKDLYSTAISMEELRDLSKRIPARHVLYVFDSCYSGLGLSRSARAPQKIDSTYLETLKGQRAVYMITAGRADERANEAYGHGLFTLHFLDGIAGAADISPKDGIVQASELGEFLAEVVGRDSANYSNPQHPQHGLLEGDGDFIFDLQPEDSLRLKQSLLAKLDHKVKKLKRRNSIQIEYDKLQSEISLLQQDLQSEYDRRLAELNELIEKKEAEIRTLNEASEQDTKPKIEILTHTITPVF